MDHSKYLSSGSFIDSNHPEVIAFTQQHDGGSESDRDRSIELYYAVRDLIQYDPYTIRPEAEHLKASKTLAMGRGFCVAKAVLYAATLRASNIPARIGFADVQNHLTTERLRALMGTDIFYFHGYTEVFLDGKWIKATPAFNQELCKKFGTLPLEFDGIEDSIFHPFDSEGRRHMQYIKEHGHYEDVPFDELMAAYRKYYPSMFSGIGKPITGDFSIEAESRPQTSSG